MYEVLAVRLQELEEWSRREGPPSTVRACSGLLRRFALRILVLGSSAVFAGLPKPSAASGTDQDPGAEEARWGQPAVFL